MIGVKIQYGDVAPEAKENFIPTASEMAFDQTDKLMQYNLGFPNYANPCELYQTVLDGTATAFPSSPQNANLGLWSEQISNDDGTFTEPIILTLRSDGQYSSQGLTLTFDSYNNIYANKINIKWYRNDELLSTKDFNPDNYFFFCHNKVENYNKVVISFYSINMPKNRLKLRIIDYGYGTFFSSNELRNVKITRTTDPISSEICISTVDFTLDSDTDIEYSFQNKQPLSVYFNGNLEATTFVRNSKRKSKRMWDVQSEDYIGVLNTVSFPGGIYVDKNAFELLTEIFTVAKVPFFIDECFKDATVTGYIPYTNCRSASMQIAFAIGAVVSTAKSDKVNVLSPKTEVSQVIPLSRIMQGQSFSDEDTVTAVEVLAHSYTPLSNDEIEAYTAENSGIGENIFVTFSEPLHSLSISSGELISYGANYAIITAHNGCVLKGKRYKHTTVSKRKNNPVVLARELERVITVDSATLVSANNHDTVLERCYAWLIRTSTVSLKIVEGRHTAEDGKVIHDTPVNVGDVITAETEFLGNLTGCITKETFSLNGGIIIKEAEMK